MDVEYNGRCLKTHKVEHELIQNAKVKLRISQPHLLQFRQS